MQLLPLGKRLPMVFQAETNECGLACIAMIGNFHGLGIDLNGLRSKFGGAALGSSARQLLDLAKSLNLRGKAVRLEPKDLSALSLPAILHWDMDHFVVVKTVARNHIIIHDPAVGIRRYSIDELRLHLTGVALELRPNQSFIRQRNKDTLQLRELLAGISLTAGNLAQVFFLTLLIQLLALLNPLYLQLVIDQGLVKGDVDLVLMLALLFALLVLMKAVLNQLRGIHLLQFGNRIGYQLVTNVAHHLQRLPLGFFEHREMGDIVSRFGSLDSIRRMVTQEMITVVVDGLFSMITLGLLYFYSPLLAAIAMVFVLMFVVVRLFSLGYERELRKESLVAAARQQTGFMENIRSVTTNKVYAIEQARLGDWESDYSKHINAGYRLESFQLSLGTVQAVLFGIENILIIYLGVGAVIAGAMTLGQLMSFIFLKQHFSSSILAMLPKLSEMRLVSLELERVADIVRHKAEADHTELSLLSSLFTGDVQLQALRFGYPGLDKHLFSDLDFCFEAGSCSAITGSSGSGKSTLLKILLKLETNYQGEILFGDKDLKLICRSDLRSNVSAVLHGDSLLAGDLAYNIHLGVGAQDNEALEQLSRQLGILDFINNLPLGFATEIGELGSILSAGQVQRILLARALYRQPKILLLDESLSHLNTDAALELLEIIKAKDITTLLVTHETDLIARADSQLILA